MKKSEIFPRELSLIKDTHLREIVATYLDVAVPDYFWTCGASSSGKYHPAFAQGKGGLVRHTKAAVMFAEELMKLSMYSYFLPDYQDFVYAALIIHDTCKYGTANEMNKDDYHRHGFLAAIHFRDFYESMTEYPCPDMLFGAIVSHMGQWTPARENRPFTPIDRVVHLADYLASRSFIDVPSLKEDDIHE